MAEPGLRLEVVDGADGLDDDVESTHVSDLEDP